MKNADQPLGKFKTQGRQCALKIGMVLKLYVKDTTPPKEKRFIILGFTEDRISLASAYINTEINPNINWAIELKEQHVFFDKTGRPYLSHASFVDCSKLIFRTTAEIQAAINNRPDAVLGELSSIDLRILVNKVINSITIKGKQKRKYGFFDFESDS